MKCLRHLLLPALLLSVILNGLTALPAGAAAGARGAAVPASPAAAAAAFDLGWLGRWATDAWRQLSQAVAPANGATARSAASRAGAAAARVAPAGRPGARVPGVVDGGELAHRVLRPHLRPLCTGPQDPNGNCG